MSNFITEVRQTLIPDPRGKQGPLPPLLVSMTLVTGLVDAFSYLVLGHVFVANMTGNVILLGFALVGAPGFSILASVLAIVAFGLGALTGGILGSRIATHRGRLLTASSAIQVTLFAVSVALAALSPNPLGSSGYRYGLIVVLAFAMGTQNAAARKLAVPDLTTTVLTLTITGIAADSALAGGGGSKSGRRLVSVGAMLAGAVIGAALVLHSHIYYPLVTALVVMALVAATSEMLGRPDAPWVKAGG